MKCTICGELLRNSIITINGVRMCEKCARAQTSRDFGAIFGSNSFIEDEIASFFPGMGINFANTSVTCPKCHSTIRDIETSGRVGCIECFNTFNETVIKKLLRTQGTSEYEGRKPGQQLELSNDKLGVITREDGIPEKQAAAPKAERKTKIKSASADDNASKAASKGVESSVAAPADDVYEKIKSSSDITSIVEADLDSAMKKAISAEDYPTAIKIRDELKRRLQSATSAENNANDGKENN